MNKHPVAVITGGSSGLGLQFAKQLALKGYDIILIARDENKLLQAKDWLKTQGADEVMTFSADISDATSMEPVISYLLSHQIKIQFLIVNAGIVYVNTLKEAELDQLHNIININLWGSMLTTKLFLGFMDIKANAKILFISSAFGLIGAAGYSAYCASKAGLINFAAALRRELLSKISVYVACPGNIDTPQYEAEKKAMPAWMNKAHVGTHSMSAELAVQKILKQCHGNHFEIFINKDLYFLLSILPRFLPLRLFNWLGDKLLPRPRD